MGDSNKCLPDELRTLFLFEALSDEQLQMLCDNGHIQSYRTGAHRASRAIPRRASTSCSTANW